MSGIERCSGCGGRGTALATGLTCPVCGGTGRVLADGPYGETMRDKRARWAAQGDCRDCGAPGPHRLPDGKLSKRCARCRRLRSSRAPGSGRAKRKGKA